MNQEAQGSLFHQILFHCFDLLLQFCKKHSKHTLSKALVFYSNFFFKETIVSLDFYGTVSVCSPDCPETSLY